MSHVDIVFGTIGTTETGTRSALAYFSSPRPVTKPLATCMSSLAALRQNSKNESCSLNCGRLKVG